MSKSLSILLFFFISLDITFYQVYIVITSNDIIIITTIIAMFFRQHNNYLSERLLN